MSRGVLLALGVALCVLGRGGVLARQLLAPLPGGADQLLIDACIHSIPEFGEEGWRFDARVRFPQHPQWPARNLRVQGAPGGATPLAGECWRYAARLEQPADAAGRRLLLRDHLSGYARVSAGPLTRRLDAGHRNLDRLRGQLARRIVARVADPSAAGLLAALAVGATGDVTPRQWQVFNATGITHLVAISGMHVTFFAVLAMAGARRLWSWCARHARLPRRSAFAAMVGAMLALLYGLLSGASVPAQRTVLMLAAFLAMRELARCTRPGWSIGVALAAVLLLDPLALLGAGFWLSFVAVAVLVLLAGGRLRPPPPLRALPQLQWMVSIALLPFTVAIFGSFPAAGLLVNLVAIPVFSLLLVPPVLIATACYLMPGAMAAWCGDALLRLAGWTAMMLWPGLCWCADLPGALWRSAPPWSWYLLGLPAAVLALLPLARALRLAGLAVLASVFLLRAPRPASGELWIDVRGEGAGALVLLRTHAHLLLVGTGEAWGSGGRRFARRALPLLRSAGYSGIDLWLPGRWSRDSQAALRLAAAEFPVRAAMLPPASSPPPELPSCMPARWQWEGIGFELHADGDGRTCVLSAWRALHGIVIGDTDGAHLALGADGSARLVLDEAGLAVRSAFLRL